MSYTPTIQTDKGLGVRSVKVEDLKHDAALRVQVRRDASKGSHPKPHLVALIDAIEKEMETQ